MSLKWIFALVLFAFGYNCFATEIRFNELIQENSQNQYKMATEIQQQLGLAHKKTPKDSSVYKTVSLEGSQIKIFN